MSISQSDVVDYIKNLKLGEVQFLITTLEDKLGVMADAPVPPVLPPDYAEIETEQTEFDVVLTDAGATRIKVIKAVRAATGFGLKEAKGLIDSAPATVREAIDRDAAEALVGIIAEAGGTAEVR